MGAVSTAEPQAGGSRHCACSNAASHSPLRSNSSASTAANPAALIESSVRRSRRQPSALAICAAGGRSRGMEMHLQMRDAYGDAHAYGRLQMRDCIWEVAYGRLQMRDCIWEVAYGRLREIAAPAAASVQPAGLSARCQ